MQEFAKALTDAASFGVPRYATSALPSCVTANKGAIAYDTTVSQVKLCDGTSWSAITGGITSGTTTCTGCVANGVLHENAGVVNTDPNFTFNPTGDLFTLNGPVTIGGTGVTGTANALVVNNGVSTGNIIEGQSNGMALFQVVDNGNISSVGPGNGISKILFGASIGSDSFHVGRANGSGTGTVGGPNTSEIGTTLAEPVHFFTNSVSRGVISASIHAWTFGNGTAGPTSGTSATPAAATLQGTGGSGTNIAGGRFNLLGGLGTGNAVPGAFVGQTGIAGATGTTLQSVTDRLWIEGRTKSLTDATATTIFTLNLGDDLVGGGTGSFCVEAADATNRQVTCGEFNFSGIDDTAGAGGEVCAAAITGTNSSSAGAGTLTVTAAATTGTDLCNIQLVATGSLTETVGPRVRWSANLHGSTSAVTITPQ